MTRSQQKRFVRELSDNIKTSVLSQIDQGLIPAAWDGHELRSLLHARHKESAGMSNEVMRGARKRSFHRHCLKNRL